jgi:hypothetical protein
MWKIHRTMTMKKSKITNLKIYFDEWIIKYTITVTFI